MYLMRHSVSVHSLISRKGCRKRAILHIITRGKRAFLPKKPSLIRTANQASFVRLDRREQMVRQDIVHLLIQSVQYPFQQVIREIREEILRKAASIIKRGKWDKKTKISTYVITDVIVSRGFIFTRHESIRWAIFSSWMISVYYEPRSSANRREGWMNGEGIERNCS